MPILFSGDRRLDQKPFHRSFSLALSFLSSPAFFVCLYSPANNPQRPRLSHEGFQIPISLFSFVFLESESLEPVNFTKNPISYSSFCWGFWRAHGGCAEANDLTIKHKEWQPPWTRERYSPAAPKDIAMKKIKKKKAKAMKLEKWKKNGLKRREPATSSWTLIGGCCEI